MTRSHKYNDRNHVDNTGGPAEHLPHFFAKHGFAGTDPKKTKKNGGGKGNWGGPGMEVMDDDFSFNKTRRRSNSLSFAPGAKEFKTKFDVNEQDPVFEESIHGPLRVADEHGMEKDTGELTKTTSISSDGSFDEDKSVKSA